jgi:hypothetical protein
LFHQFSLFFCSLCYLFSLFLSCCEFSLVFFFSFILLFYFIVLFKKCAKHCLCTIPLFRVCCNSHTFIFKYFLICLVLSFLTHQVFRSICLICEFSKFILFLFIVSVHCGQKT